MGASGLARPPLAQLLFVRIRFAPAHHPWGAHGRHFKNSAASKNQIYGIKNWSGRADLNGRERARAAAPRTAFVCAHPLRSCASPLGCSWSALQKFCRLQKSDLWDKELVGTGRFEWARAGSRGRPSHSFCLCASASLLRITLGVLMVGTSKILPPPKIRFMG